MNPLETHLDHYLQLRRRLGFKLRVQGILLRNFVPVRRAETRGLPHHRLGAGMGHPAGPHQPSPKSQSLGRRAPLCQIPERDWCPSTLPLSKPFSDMPPSVTRPFRIHFVPDSSSPNEGGP
jgi:hypothetical protein